MGQGRLGFLLVTHNRRGVWTRRSIIDGPSTRKVLGSGIIRVLSTTPGCARVQLRCGRTERVRSDQPAGCGVWLTLSE